MGDCKDIEIPKVDNTLCECQDGIHSTECVVLEEMITFLSLPAGSTLTKTLERFVNRLKSHSTAIEANTKTYYEIELLMTQTGTSAPTSTELIKEIPNILTYQYNGIGDYSIISANAFIGNVRVYVGSSNIQYGESIKAYKINNSEIRIRTGVDNSYNTNGLMNLVPITIKIPK